MKIHYAKFVPRLHSQIALTNRKSLSNVLLVKMKVICDKIIMQNEINIIFNYIAHPSCIQMSQRMYVRSLAYSWQCSSCKSCSKCRKSKDNKMLYCIQCDRGFHIYCLGLRNVPEGKIKRKFIIHLKLI